MPASPSDGRRKWKRRKNRKPKYDELDDDDDMDDSVDLEDSEEPNKSSHLATTSVDLVTHEAEVLAEGGARICDFPVVVRHVVNRPHSSVKAIVALERANSVGHTLSTGHVAVNLENVSYGQLQALSRVPVESVAGTDQGSSGPPYVITPPPILEGSGIVKRFGNRVHVVPMHSGDWFSPAQVHRLERQVVPQFFSSKSQSHTPENYMECRNFIVSKYMENPEKRLTISDCEGLIVGVDNADLTRIFRFLDNWGIINYCAAALNDEPWSSGSYVREDSGGEIHVPSAALKSIQSLIKFDSPKCRLKAADAYSTMSCRVDDISDLGDRLRERFSDNYCNFCSQPLCSAYYQSNKEADVLLCSDCFHDAKFVVGHSSIDFVKTDSSNDYGNVDGESWSDQETLMLLEAMDMYNENWNEIAEHVGTKSKSQCTLHFLRLPMEDGKLDNIEVPSTSNFSNSSNRDDPGSLHSNSNGSSLRHADSESRLPFANSGNPVMALVSFLASAIGPRVAAACAHASLATLSGHSSLADSKNIARPGGSGRDNRISSDGMRGREGSSHSEWGTTMQQREEISQVRTLHGEKEADVTTFSAEKVQAAVQTGLSAAALKAKLFADHEEREIQRLYANVVNQQLKRLELKLKQFAEIETLLMRECELVEKTRMKFAGERSRILATRFGASPATSQMNFSSVGNNNIINNRPAQMPAASLSQSGISSGSYRSNQSTHPQIPFMQRPSMFPSGPQLAVQTSSPSSSNHMFAGAQGNNNQSLRSVSRTNSGLG